MAAAAALAFDDLTPAQIAEFEAECENGDLQVCGGLGEGYESREFGFVNDHARAQYYFEKACAQADLRGDSAIAEACFNLALMHFDELDYKRAAQFYSVACEAGNAGSCTNLGRMCEEGQRAWRGMPLWP